MRQIFRSIFLLAITAVTVAQAAPVTYTFTATLLDGDDTYFGSTISGTTTLDPSAAPTILSAAMGGEGGYWLDGAFAINIITSTGYMAGTLDGGSTYYTNTDIPMFSQNDNLLVWNKDDGISNRQIALYTRDGDGDGLATVVNPWIPLTAATAFLNLSDYNDLSGQGHSSTFTIVSFAPVAPVSPNIFIDGKDTGIKDLTYQGQSVSAILAGYAASAKNHGGYVSSVEKLVEKLIKAKLLTKTQAESLKKAAEKSSIGQKPKKEKEDKDDKDDKGKSDNDKEDKDD